MQNTWKEIGLKWKATFKGLKGADPKDALEKLNELVDETLRLVKENEQLKEIVTFTLFAIMLKSWQDPNVMNEWLNQEAKSWTDPKMLKTRLEALRNENESEVAAES